MGPMIVYSILDVPLCLRPITLVGSPSPPLSIPSLLSAFLQLLEDGGKGQGRERERGGRGNGKLEEGAEIERGAFAHSSKYGVV